MKTKNIILSVAAAATMFAAGSCSDTWDEHYDRSSLSSGQTLMQMIDNNPELSQFAQVLRATHIYRNNRITKSTYADLLNSDQITTVWAPKNGSFNVDSLLEECMTNRGDSLCGEHFIMNHMARHIYNNSAADTAKVRLYNYKFAKLSPEKFGNISYAVGETNQTAKNGMLHVLDKAADYDYNIYEAVTSLDSYRFLGDFIMSYQKLELNEDASIVADIVDGQKIYSDSVMSSYNPFLWSLEPISAEDSNFVMMMPNEATWTALYNEAFSLYNYGNQNNADSLQRVNAVKATLFDAIYNRNIHGRHIEDSIYSSRYDRYADDIYHVYYKPFEPGGIFSTTYVQDSMPCSNGKIYNMRSWPLKSTDTYFTKVRIETENKGYYLQEFEKCTCEPTGDLQVDTVSHGYLDINGSSDWNATFKIYNTLSGTYDVYAVVLPITVKNPVAKKRLPNKFKAGMTYITTDGTKKTEMFDVVENDPEHPDTVLMGRITFPVTSYGLTDPVVTMTIQSNVGRNTSKYSRNMLLDFLYFKPVTQEQ